MQYIVCHDQRLDDDARRSPKTVVFWIVAASYAYYILDRNLLSDGKFDYACRWLLENYDSVTHRLKHLLPRDCLEAGSPHHLKESDYPEGVKRIVRDLLVELEN